jgi:hypothetical protein
MGTWFMGKLVKYFVLLCAFLSYPLKGQGAPYEKYVDEIIDSVARDMLKEQGIICVGSGGRMPRNVETIKIFFHSYRRTSVEEARKLVIRTKEILVNKVNMHEKIRPFLKTYPFTWREAHICISFYHPHSGSHYLDGSVAIVCTAALGKEIAYDAAELQMRKLPDFQDLDGSVEIGETVEREVFVPLLTETYEQALEIVKASQSNGNLVH